MSIQQEEGRKEGRKEGREEGLWLLVGREKSLLLENSVTTWFQ